VIADAGNGGAMLSRPSHFPTNGEDDGHDDETTGASPLIGLTISFSAAAAAAASCILLFFELCKYHHLMFRRFRFNSARSLYEQ